jgi:hypothetical protein
MIQFPATEAREEQPAQLGWRFASAEGDRVEMRQRILGLPLEQRAKFLQELAGTAKGVLNAQAVQKFNSPRFLVFTDAPNPDLARVLATNLEATFDTRRSCWPRRRPAARAVPRRGLHVRERSAFDALKKRVEVAECPPAYSPLGMLASTCRWCRANRCRGHAARGDHA